jgi:ribose/xylose/arabinose/galactoside ABC-type transport system permease subunit
MTTPLIIVIALLVGYLAGLWRGWTLHRMLVRKEREE